MSETKDGLANPKHELFCIEYLKDLNATQAAVRTGYSVKSARFTGCRILACPDVRQRIEKLKADRMSEAKVDANYVLNRLLAIDRLSVEDLLDDNGDLKEVKDWSEDWKMSIQALDIQVSSSGGAKTTTKKVRIPDKLRNLEMLGKHIGVSAFKERETELIDNDGATVVVHVDSLEAKENVEKLESKLVEE